MEKSTHVFNMFSAQKAKEMTYESISIKRNNELKEISKLISSAISQGTFSICREGRLCPETILELKNLGYMVEQGSQYNQSYYTIKW